MLTNEQVVEYLIMIDLQRKGVESKLNAEGLSTLLDLQSNKELKDVTIIDILDYIHAQEEKLAEKDKEIRELKDSVDYWKNEVFKKMEVKLVGVTKEKIQEIRKQVCDEIRDKVDSIVWYNAETVYNDLHKILDQIEKENNNETAK